jgi:uncharacterized protein (TIGR03435 family)
MAGISLPKPFRTSSIETSILVLLLTALALRAFGQAVIPPETASPSTVAKALAYEVATIKPHRAGIDESYGWRIAPEGFSAGPIKPQMLIVLAYDLHSPNQIVDLPAWASTESFDIKAKTDEETAAALKLSESKIKSTHRLMLQALLADRFQLKVHHETHPLPVYDLVIAKSGLKMKASPAGESSWSGMSSGYISGRADSVNTLAFNLSNEIDRQVLDKTGLTGNYDFKLTWTPTETRAPADSSSSTPATVVDSAPSIFSAIEEQLGLKLVSDKAPVDVLVVDHVERPSEN